MPSTVIIHTRFGHTCYEVKHSPGSDPHYVICDDDSGLPVEVYDSMYGYKEWFALRLVANANAK